MTYAMVAHIIFPANKRRTQEINIRRPNSVKIESGWETLTDTATIVMPRNVRYFDKKKVRELFKGGDKVIIKLGYNGHLQTEFIGYVTQVSADIPIKIKCEDSMYLLKKHRVNISMKRTSLPSLIRKIVPKNWKIDVMNLEFGASRFPKTTTAKVLEWLQQEYNIYSYITDENTLVVGKIYSDNSTVLDFDFRKTIINDALEYKHADDILLKIEGVSTLRNGDKIEVTIGDPYGEVRRLSYYNITTRAEVEKLARIDYEKFKIDGFTGTIKILGTPSVKHGYQASLNSERYPDRNGKYYIKKVTKIFDDSPKFHQTLELDKKVI